MYTRKTITLPADGEFLEMSIEGCGLVVESVPNYSNVQSIPGFRYDDRTSSFQPMYKGGNYSPGKRGFSRLVFESTAASAGDSVTILISSIPIDPGMNIASGGVARVTLKDTFKFAVIDAVVALSDLDLLDDSGQYPSAMYITARGGNIVYAFGVDPVQGAAGLGHVLKDNEVQKIEGINFITKFRAINETAAATTALSFTLEY